MKDVGFRVIDRHTALIALISMTLAQVFLGFPLPVDSTSIKSLFVDLLLFTGYIYAARSLYRLPVALVASLIVLKEDFHDDYQIHPVLRLPWRVFSFGRWAEETSHDFFTSRITQAVFGILDRAGLIIICILATLPSLYLVVKEVGAIGLVLMLGVFLIRGSFTSLVRDNINRKKEEAEEREFRKAMIQLRKDTEVK